MHSKDGLRQQRRHASPATASQSIGKTRVASFLSTLRGGLCYIPVLLILPHFLGFTGIQCAQMVSDILTTLITVPFTVRFFRSLPKEDVHGKIDEMYEGVNALEAN